MISGKFFAVPYLTPSRSAYIRNKTNLILPVVRYGVKSNANIMEYEASSPMEDKVK